MVWRYQDNHLQGFVLVDSEFKTRDLFGCLILPTLTEVQKHITEKGHLENIPSEEEVLKKGINLGDMNAKLLQKIEELTLYLLKQDKSIEDLKIEVNNLKKQYK